jgi:hypothetical protein
MLDVFVLRAGTNVLSPYHRKNRIVIQSAITDQSIVLSLNILVNLRGHKLSTLRTRIIDQRCGELAQRIS